MLSGVFGMFLTVLGNKNNKQTNMCNGKFYHWQKQGQCTTEARPGLPRCVLHGWGVCPPLPVLAVLVSPISFSPYFGFGFYFYLFCACCECCEITPFFFQPELGTCYVHLCMFPALLFWWGTCSPPRLPLCGPFCMFNSSFKSS